MKSTDFGGAAPLRVVELVSGSGTFTPLVANSWCRITLVGAGAGGARRNATNGGGGGQPGCITVFWMRVASALSYAVGAGGIGALVNTDVPGAGGNTSIGPAICPGGSSGSADSQNVSAVLSTSQGLAGPVAGATTGNATNGGSGGNTPYGKGGVGAAIGVVPTAPTGYGSGGPGGFNVAALNGAGGLILIEEFGA